MNKDNEKIPLKYRAKLSWDNVRGYIGLGVIAAIAVAFPIYMDFTKIDPVLSVALICGVYIILGGFVLLCIKDIRQSRNISNLILYDFKTKKKEDST